MADESEKTRAVEKITTIHATADAVWHALTDAEGLTRWFAAEARAEKGVGGTVWISFCEGMAGEEKISHWEPGKRLQWTFSRQVGVQLYVDFYLEDVGGGATKVRLVHSGFSTDAQWDGEYDAYDRGWTIYALNLRHALERKPNATCIQTLVMRKTELSRLEAWKILLGPQGLDRDGAFATPPAAGDAYKLTMADGTVLEGKVEVFTPGRDLALTLDNFDEALFRLTFEGSSSAFIFDILMTYGLAPEAAAKLRKSCGDIMTLLDTPTPQPAANA